MKFTRFCFCSTGHTRKFFIHTKVILNGNCGIGFGFFLNRHPFLRLHCLMQTITPSPPGIKRPVFSSTIITCRTAPHTACPFRTSHKLEAIGKRYEFAHFVPGNLFSASSRLFSYHPDRSFRSISTYIVAKIGNYKALRIIGTDQVLPFRLGRLAGFSHQ